MSEGRLISVGDLLQSVITPDTLGEGGIAFHGQLFPGVYPPAEDHHADYLLRAANFCGELAARETLHDQVRGNSASYRSFVRNKLKEGIRMQRLRTLPDHLGEQVMALIDQCLITSETGEEVRLCLFPQQVSRLQATYTELCDQSDPDAQAAVPDLGSLYFGLRQGIPRSGLWSFHSQPEASVSTDKQPNDPDIIGIMDYSNAGTLPGVRLHMPPSAGHLAYARFWRQVYDSNEHSVDASNWHQLYT